MKRKVIHVKFHLTNNCFCLHVSDISSPYDNLTVVLVTV